MQAAAGSALVPQSGSGSEPSPLALCWRTLTTITRTTTPTATTDTIHPLRLTIRLRRITRLRGAVGAPITITTTLAEQHPRPPVQQIMALGITPAPIRATPVCKRIIKGPARGTPDPVRGNAQPRIGTPPTRRTILAPT